MVEGHEAVHRYASDPEVARYTDSGPDDLEATKVFLAEVQASASHVSRTRYAPAIVRQDSDELIGSVELQITSQENGCGVLGYVLDRRSVATPLKLPPECCDAAFVELGLRSISATCDPDNAASAAVLDTAADGAEFLGYRYPETLCVPRTDHARRMRQGQFNGGPLPAYGAVEAHRS